MKPKQQTSLLSIFLHPKYLHIWIGFALLWLCSHLPYTLQLSMGRCLGRLALPFASHRRHITAVNLRLCFPNLTEEALSQLLTRCFESAGIAVFETGMAWWMSKRRLAKLFQIEGLNHLDEALAQGRGALILVFHFTTLEMAGRMMTMHRRYNGVYRKHKNPAFEWVLHKMRTKGVEELFGREEVKGFLKSFKQNKAVFYAPDQDYGRKQSVFVPFFGVNTATVTATSRIAKLARAPVLTYVVERRDDGKGYLATLNPPLENYPTEDFQQDAMRINTLVERAILKRPEQYLWQHRRFKTRPLGEPSVY